MLELATLGIEQYDEANDRLITTKKQVLRLEHSLASLSKRESKWHKPYLSRESKTQEERTDYVRYMTLIQNVGPDIYAVITPQILKIVDACIDDSMTVTTFARDREDRSANEVITAEITHYWMLSHQTPFKCQRWHLSRLMTLTNVYSARSGPQKKMSQKEIFAQNRALNATRKKRASSKEWYICPKQ